MMARDFVDGAVKRLHPQGSHPGLSDEETLHLRLYLTFLVPRLFLPRLDDAVITCNMFRTVLT